MDLEYLLSQVRVKEENGRKVIVKDYLSFNSLKWYLLSFATSGSYPFSSNPNDRFNRELEFMRIDDHDIPHPRIINCDSESKTMEREYIERKNEMIPPRKIAELLSKIHDYGYVLGDTKLSNFILGQDDRVYIIDAEQAIRSDSPELRAWDVDVVLAFYGLKNYFDLNGFKADATEFLSNYKGLGGISNYMFNLETMVPLFLIPLTHIFWLYGFIQNFEIDSKASDKL